MAFVYYKNEHWVVFPFRNLVIKIKNRIYLNTEINWNEEIKKIIRRRNSNDTKKNTSWSLKITEVNFHEKNAFLSSWLHIKLSLSIVVR